MLRRALLACAAAAGAGALRGASLQYSQVINTAVSVTLSWTPDAAADSIDVCISAVSITNASDPYTPTKWIGIGFGGTHGRPNRTWMQDEDIVVGYVDGAGAVAIQPLYAEVPAAYPNGANVLTLSGGSFSDANGVLEVCFTRPISGGHNPLGDNAKVIWGHGPVVNGNISYHGKDGKDDTGNSQIHRCDEAPGIMWLSGN